MPPPPRSSFPAESTTGPAHCIVVDPDEGLQAEFVEVDPGRVQVVGRLRGSGGGRSLMLNGHMDIDPLPSGMTRDPWTPSIEGDRYYGAGIGNMKGGIGTAGPMRRGLRDRVPDGCARRATLDGADRWTSVSQILTATRVYADMIRRVCA